MRFLWALLLAVLPSRLKRPVGRLLLGWDIHPTAHVGRSIILARRVSLGPGASIGSMNMIRGLDELRLDEGASIATRNWIACPPTAAEAFTHSPRRHPALIMGKHTMITTHHEIDCSDRVELADHARIAGSATQVLTHSLDLVRDRWATGPVVLGEQSVVMSGCILMSGTRIPRRAIISAGSVVNTKLNAEQTFYRGNPAEAVRPLPDTLKYWRRAEAGALDEADL